MKEHFPGKKTKSLFKNFIEKELPNNYQLYIYAEPFGGTFAVGNMLGKYQYKKIYNDIKTYDFEIKADIIEHLDFEEFIEKYDSTLTLFYLDPPYYDKEHHYGLERKDIEFHYRLLYKLKNIKGKFLLSYQDNPFIRKLYKDFTIISNESDSHKIRNKEILIKNY